MEQIKPKKPFLAHLQELKNRFILWFISFILFSVVGYFLRNQILSFLISPLKQPLYFSSPAGAFSFTFSLSLFFGFLMSIPVLFYQILEFVEPLFSYDNRKNIAMYLASSVIYLLAGVIFAYYIVLPASLDFLLNFGGADMKSLITTNEYFSFVSRYLIGFGLLFQLPLIMLFANSIKRLNFKKLLSFERWVILFSFAIAAVLTPTPDVVNQTIMAVPIIILYQVSVGIIWLINRNST